MKSILLISLFLPFIGTSQNERYELVDTVMDSIVFQCAQFTCMDSEDTIYKWKESPDSVKIKFYNRWGELILITEDKSCTVISILEENNKKIPIGVYFVINVSFYGNREKFFVHYIQLGEYCGCG
jgi:hypothetical protein